MILLSAHRDTVMNHYRLEYKDGVFTGLLDNWIGVFITNLLLFDDPVISQLEKRGDLKIFMGTTEEWGTIELLPAVTKNDIVLVIDMETGDQYNNVDFGFVNISGFSKKQIKDLQKHLEWEGFKTSAKMYDGNPDNEDESWKWRDKKARVISVVIPCRDNGKTGWHVDNCSITYEKVNICKQGIKRLINYLL